MNMSQITENSKIYFVDIWLHYNNCIDIKFYTETVHKGLPQRYGFHKVNKKFDKYVNENKAYFFGGKFIVCCWS